jgi:hypothetical protein
MGKKIKTLIEKEIIRCNKNLISYTFGLTLLAFLLGYTYFNLDNTWGQFLTIFSFLLLVGLAIYLLNNYYQIYLRIKDPLKNNPDYKLILRLGDSSKISKRIEEDISKNLLSSSAENKNYKNNLLITPNWILIKNFLHFYIIHTTELVWVYKKQTRYNYRNPTYDLNLYSNYLNKKIEVRMKGDILEFNSEEKCDSNIRLIHLIAPWAIYGFDREIERLWNSNPNKLIQETNQRVLEYQEVSSKNREKK